MKRRIFPGCVMLGVFFGGCLAGCTAHGHRKVTITAFGMQFGFEDEVSNDSDGKPDYQSGFVKADPFVEWFVGPPITIDEASTKAMAADAKARAADAVVPTPAVP